MKIQFKINKEYLLTHSLGQIGITPFPEWVNFLNKLWKKNEELSCLLQGRPHLIFINNATKKTYKFNANFNNFIKYALKTKEYNKLYLQTEKYLNFIKNQWYKNETAVYNFLEQTLGLKLPPAKKINILITHPSFKNGFAYTQHDSIGWGHKEEWKNYSTVYITHEILHILTKKFNGDQEIMHAIIELACDNELRIQLNKRGVYFKEGNQKIGHPSLYKIERKILPAWKKFLYQKDNKVSVISFSLKQDKKLKKLKQ